eukprot:m.14157 g.14157  ORF g.14157 m.14157 type:complete len:451 (-) comp3127_c0_seq1:102-1454(-)
MNTQGEEKGGSQPPSTTPTEAVDPPPNDTEVGGRGDEADALSPDSLCNDNNTPSVSASPRQTELESSTAAPNEATGAVSDDQAAVPAPDHPEDGGDGVQDGPANGAGTEEGHALPEGSSNNGHEEEGVMEATGDAGQDATKEAATADTVAPEQDNEGANGDDDAPTAEPPSTSTTNTASVLIQSGNKFVMLTGADLLAHEQAQTTKKGAGGMRPKSAAVHRQATTTAATTKRKPRPKSASVAQTQAEKAKQKKLLSFSSTFKPPPGVPAGFKSESARDAYEAFVRQKRHQSGKHKQTEEERKKIEARRAEEARKNEEAYQAWKQAKDAELAKVRAAQIKKQKDKDEEVRKHQEEKAKHFQEWVQTKKVVKIQQKKKEETAHVYVEHVQELEETRKHPQDAYREWLAKKRETRRKEKEQEKERHRQFVMEARYIKRRMQERLHETASLYHV